MLRGRLLPAFSTFVVGALVAGCVAPVHAGLRTPVSPTSTSTTTSVPPTTVAPQTVSDPAAVPPVSPVNWGPCAGGADLPAGLQCGWVTVPLDYADPTGRTIDIAVARLAAADPADRIGSLVINPGGPGVSGIDDLATELSVMPSGLRDRFDIVSFDPRGVERSSPVNCGGPAVGQGGPLDDPAPTTSAGVLTLIGDDQAYARDCEAHAGDLLPYMSTVDTALDLERIRVALGDPELTFIGHSYGTLLGATYAELFPTHVRAMVLDGPLDPALTTDQMTRDQAEGFENALDQFFTWCAQSSSCAWRPAGDATAAVLALLARARQQPIAAGGGRVAGPGELYRALLAGLYSSSSWPTLGQALAAAADGDGSPVVALSDSYSRDGSTNGADAASAITCLDLPVSRNLAVYPALAAEDATVAPVFGPMLAWGEMGCARWPVAATRQPAPIRAAGTPPILVVGTTGDPATPYAWAQALAGQLADATLLTWQGQSHVAYFYSACVRADYEAYLVDLTVPAPGTICS